MGYLNDIKEPLEELHDEAPTGSHPDCGVTRRQTGRMLASTLFHGVLKQKSHLTNI